MFIGKALNVNRVFLVGGASLIERLSVGPGLSL
jgi:hypothetical protein